MNKRILLVLLVSTSVITMMSTDLYVPSLAHLPELLGASPELVKLGAAAAMIVSTEMAIGSMAALTVSWIHDGTALPMMITMQVLVVIIVLAYISSLKSS